MNLIKGACLTLVAMVFAIPLLAQCPVEASCGSLAVQGGPPAGSPTFFCVGEVVGFENATDPALVDTTIMVWGDGVLDTFTSQLFYQHVYEFPEDTCFVGNSALIFPVTMIVINNCGDDLRSVNCLTTFVRIQVEPVADFIVNPVHCVGVGACFFNLSCKNADEATYLWDFGGLGSSTEEHPCFTFPTPGEHIVTLTTTNGCGSDTYSLPVTIIDVASNGGIVTDAALQVNDFEVCLEENPFICLNGDSLSTSATLYYWEVLQSSGYVFFNSPVLPEIKIEFTAPGIYDIVLMVDNLCNQPSFDTLTVEVFTADIEMNPHEDGCISLDYSPNPIDEQLSYYINSAEESDFPITLDPGTYFIEAHSNSSACTVPILYDTIEVLTPGVATILTPETTLCIFDSPFTFEATPENGDWRIDGILFSGILNPATLAAGTYQVIYGKEPCIEPDTTFVTLVGTAIAMPNDIALCTNDDPQIFTASPPGGVWSTQDGINISPNGIFDPSSVDEGTYTFYYETMNPDFPACTSRDSFLVFVGDIAVDFEVVNCDGYDFCFELINNSPFTNISWDFGGLAESDVINPCFTFPEAQDYIVSATINDAICSASIVKLITVLDPPVADMSLNYNPNLCSPLVVSFNNNSTGDDLTYSWLLNGIEFSNEAIPNSMEFVSSSLPMSYEITLIVSNECGTDMQSESFLLEPGPVSNFGTNQNQYCSGDTILVSNASPVPGSTYEWFVDGVSFSQDSIPPVITHVTSEVDTLEICLLVYNNCGVDALCRTVVVIPTDVSAFFNIAPDIICTNATIQITNFATPGVPVIYHFGDGNSTSQPNPTYTYNQAGQYLVTQEAFGCATDTFDVLIDVEAGPLSNWINPIIGCLGEEVYFNNNTTGAVEFEWNFGDGTPNSFEQSPVHTFNSAGVYEVCLSSYAGPGQSCVHTLCQSVEIFNPPSGGFLVPDSLCLGDEALFTSTVDCEDFAFYYDFGYEDNISTFCNPSHVYTNSGSFLVTQIVEDHYLCRDTVQHEVYVRSLPTADFMYGTQNGCHPDSVNFTNLSQNATSYEWTFSDAPSSTNTHLTRYYPNPGIYEVTLTATNVNLCSAEQSQVVTIFETPVSGFTSNSAAICQGLEMQFTGLATGPITQYQWDFDDDVFSFEENPSHVFDSPGIYEVELLVSGENSCSDSTTLQITVYEAVAMQNFNTDAHCFGGNTGAIMLDILAGAAPFNFNWSNGQETKDIDMLSAGEYSVTVTDANTCQTTESFILSQAGGIQLSSEQEPTSCFDLDDGSIELVIAGGTAPYDILWENGESTALIENLFSGNYSVTVTDDEGCMTETEIFLPGNPQMEIMDSISQISCFGIPDGKVILTSISGGVGPYFAEIVSGNFMDSGLGVTQFNQLGPAVYDVLVEDANGCTESFVREILEPGSVSVNIIEDTIVINNGNSATIHTSYDAIDPVFNWSPPKWLDCPTCQEPLVTPEQSQQYFVEMKDENDCLAIDSVLVLMKIERNIFIPNTFTPNSDSRNDVFLIRSAAPLSIDEIQVFQIFDRWGELLFEQKHFPPNESAYGWNGSFRGKMVEPGVYVYYAEVVYADGELLQWKGEVLLIRN